MTSTCATLLLIKMLDELRSDSRRHARDMILSVTSMSTTVWALTSVARFTMFGNDVGDGSIIWKRFRSNFQDSDAIIQELFSESSARNDDLQIPRHQRNLLHLLFFNLQACLSVTRCSHWVYILWTF